MPAPGRPPVPPPPFTRWDAVVAVACGGFVLLWGNRYLSPTIGTGAELFIGREFGAGRLPYRDYYYSLPPAYALWCAAVVRVFGERLVLFYLAAGLLRAWSGWVLYRWLLRVGPPWAAAAAAGTAFVAGTADVCDCLGWYNIYPPIWATLLGYALSRRLDAPGRAGRRWVAAAGLLVGVNLLTKQTAGAITGGAAVAAFEYAISRRDGFRAAARDAGGLLAAAALPCLAVSAWLILTGTWDAYIEQVYVRGPASKGGLVEAMLRPAWMTVHVPLFRAGAAAGLGVLLLTLLARVARRPGGAVPAAAAGVAVAAATFVAGRMDTYLHDTRAPLIAAIYASSFGCVWMTVRAFGDSVRRTTPAVLHRGVMGSTAVGLAYALSMSWPACEPMLVPGLGIVLAVGLGLPGVAGPRVRLRTALLGVCLILTAAGGLRKVFVPSTWGGWTEPPVFAGTVEPASPKLAGFRLSPGTAEFYDRVLGVIAERSGPDDTLLTYPNLAGLYGLADRRPAAFCLTHWIDVCPDYVAEADAARVVANPPKVIVLLEQPEADVAFNEEVFRGGRPSGQRALRAAIDGLLPGYERVAEFGPPRAQYPIRVYVRRDR